MRVQTLFCTIVLAASAAAAQRGITAEDYFALASISDAHLSPDARQVVYTLTTVDRLKNRRDNSIWMVAADGHSEPRRLSAEGVNSTSPRWSPDGSRIAFLSTRGTGTGDDAPRPQLWILNLNGGEAQA